MRQDPFTQELRFHRGIDIAAPEGTPVEAALGGKVLFSGYADGFGNTVVVEHGEGYQTRYAHLGSLEVVKGDLLETEQLLGSVGSTGRSTGPHLHFEVSRYGERINPSRALAE
jgi:murein DD-endopeptidase MepM/ murein hydrolase activator NlpD